MTRTTPARPVDVEAVFPELRGHALTATRLHPRRGNPSVHDSSVGGQLLWPEDEPWPVCAEVHRKDRGELLAHVREARRMREDFRRLGTDPNDEERERLKVLDKRGRYAPDVMPEDPIPLLAVGQFYARDVPGLEAPSGCDLLQVLWCPFERHDGHQVHLRLVWRSTADVGVPVTTQPEFPVVDRDGCVPSPCVLHPETVREHQYVELLPADLQAKVERWTNWDDEDAPDYQSDLSVAPGWKIGGFAKWNVTGPGEVPVHCGRPMRLLLTMATSEWDGGNRSWVPVEDQQNVGVMKASTPTDISVSRWGNMYIFVCADDATHPHWIMTQ